jgi:hypothetical protein
MPNILETAINAVNSLLDDEKPQPVHIGEAMLCWTYYATIGEFNSYTKSAINTTKDSELRKMLNVALALCTSQMERLKLFMIKEGIQLPDIPPMKPDSDPSSIPIGVKLTDNEIANAISIKIAGAIISCATGISQAIRTDVGLIWAEYLQEQITLGVPVKNMLLKRGWLKQPPFYVPPGIPQQ